MSAEIKLFQGHRVSQSLPGILCIRSFRTLSYIEISQVCRGNLHSKLLYL